MKVKHITSLAALAGASMFAGTAQADFVAIEAIQIFASQTPGSASGSPASHGFITFRIWVAFDALGTNAAGDANQVVFVGAEPGQPGLLDIPAVFENVVLGLVDYNPPTAGFVAAIAGLEWDSFATIGINPDGTGVNAFANTPDFGGVSGGLFDWSGGVSDNNSGWFTDGPNSDGLAVAAPTSTGFGVFIAQLSFEGAPGGDFSAQIQNGLGENFIGTAILIPSPGALALLGMAGLTGIRRRRRA